MADEHPLDGQEGKRVKVTPASGEAYEGVVRSVHETGYTVWLDGEKKDEGEVRTVHTLGPKPDGSVELLKDEPVAETEEAHSGESVP